MVFGNITKGSLLLEKTLDATWKRNEVISHNLANIDTPNYKKSTLHFEDLLQSALSSTNFENKKTDKRHIDFSDNDPNKIVPVVKKDYSTLSYRYDNNNVDVEQENALKAENSIKYDTLLTSLNNSYSRLRTAIFEGRK